MTRIRKIEKSNPPTSDDGKEKLVAQTVIAVTRKNIIKNNRIDHISIVYLYCKEWTEDHFQKSPRQR